MVGEPQPSLEGAALIPPWNVGAHTAVRAMQMGINAVIISSFTALKGCLRLINHNACVWGDQHHICLLCSSFLLEGLSVL